MKLSFNIQGTNLNNYRPFSKIPQDSLLSIQNFFLQNFEQAYREEKSLRHVAMVAKFLDDNKPIKSLKKLFALFQTLPILFNFI